MQNTTTDYLPESSPPAAIVAERHGNVTSAAAHIAESRRLLLKARRDCLSGHEARLYSALAERLGEMGQAVQRLGRRIEASR